jgi:hypothetical protein
MGESPEGVRAPQMMPAAPMGPLVVQQSMGAPVVYGTQNALPQGSIGHYFGPQGSNVVGLSQQSMCAGVPPREMASQYVPVVMAMEEMNPWSDAKRVEALTSSLLTHVKESTYPAAPQRILRGRAAIQQELDNMGATCESGLERDRARETGGGHKSPQSSGGFYQTASPEQKSIELNPAQGQGVQLLMKVGEQLVAAPPPPPRVEQEHRHGYVYELWLDDWHAIGRRA